MTTKAEYKNSMLMIHAEIFSCIAVRAGVRKRLTDETVFSQNCSPYRIGRRHITHEEAGTD